MAKKAKIEKTADSVSPETILKYSRSIGQLKEALDSANGIYRAEIKRAKSAGVNVTQLLAALRDKKADLDQINVNLKDRIYYRAILGIPVEQGYLFGSPKVSDDIKQQVTVDDAQAAGFHAGKNNGSRADNLHPVGSEMYVAWDKGWLAGQEVIAKQMGRNAKRTTVASTARNTQVSMFGGKNKGGRPRKNGAGLSVVGDPPAVEENELPPAA